MAHGGRPCLACPLPREIEAQVSAYDQLAQARSEQTREETPYVLAARHLGALWSTESQRLGRLCGSDGCGIWDGLAVLREGIHGLYMVDQDGQQRPDCPLRLGLMSITAEAVDYDLLERETYYSGGMPLRVGEFVRRYADTR